MNSATKEELNVTTTNLQQDFKLVNKKDDKHEKLTNILFGILIAITLSCTLIILNKLQDFRNDLKEKNSKYTFPNYSDLSIAVVAMLILIVL